MAQGPRYSVAFRRRREGRTDYHRRRNLLKGGLPRLVVRGSNRNMSVQFVSYEPTGDRIIGSATSLELGRFGWDRAAGNLPGAYLVGLLAGKRMSGKLPDGVVLDLGRTRPVAGGRYFAALKGVLDAGIDVPHDEDVLPPEERLTGGHIDSATLPALVEKVKTKIVADPFSGRKPTIAPKGKRKGADDSNDLESLLSKRKSQEE